MGLDALLSSIYTKPETNSTQTSTDGVSDKTSNKFTSVDKKEMPTTKMVKPKPKSSFNVRKAIKTAKQNYKDIKKAIDGTLGSGSFNSLLHTTKDLVTKGKFEITPDIQAKIKSNMVNQIYNKLNLPGMNIKDKAKLLSIVKKLCDINGGNRLNMDDALRQMLMGMTTSELNSLIACMNNPAILREAMMNMLEDKAVSQLGDKHLSKAITGVLKTGKVNFKIAKELVKSPIVKSNFKKGFISVKDFIKNKVPTNKKALNIKTSDQIDVLNELGLDPANTKQMCMLSQKSNNDFLTSMIESASKAKPKNSDPNKENEVDEITKKNWALLDAADKEYERIHGKDKEEEKSWLERWADAHKPKDDDHYSFWMHRQFDDIE